MERALESCVRLTWGRNGVLKLTHKILRSDQQDFENKVLHLSKEFLEKKSLHISSIDRKFV